MNIPKSEPISIIPIKTRKDFDKIIDEICKHHKPQRRLVLHTSYVGMILFHLALMDCHISIPNWWSYEPSTRYKRKYQLIISIDKKHGFAKAYLNKDGVFEIKVGTKLLFETKDLNEDCFNKIKIYL